MNRTEQEGLDEDVAAHRALVVVHRESDMKMAAEHSPWTEQEFLDRSRRVEHYTGVEVDMVTGEWIAYRNGRIAGWYKTQEEAEERLQELT